jgi:hypothetical protein
MSEAHHRSLNLTTGPPPFSRMKTCLLLVITRVLSDRSKLHTDRRRFDPVASAMDIQLVYLIPLEKQMACADFWQPYAQWLDQGITAGQFPVVRYHIAGNRSENNRFVLFMTGVFFAHNPVPQLGNVDGLAGEADQYFSDRITGGGKQPFDAARKVRMFVFVGLPNGPLQFQDQHAVVEASFSNFDCRDNGLLVATSQFDRTIIVMSLRTALAASQLDIEL